MCFHGQIRNIMKFFRRILCLSVVIFYFTGYLRFTLVDNEENWNKTQLRRKEQLTNGCSQLNHSSKIHSLEYLVTYRETLDNILYDDVHKFLYCYIPKIACTQWKRLLMVLKGMINDTGDPEDIDLLEAHSASYIMNLSDLRLKPEDIEKRLKTYTKFLIVRHPLERLLSAYRDKFLKNTLSARLFKNLFAVEIMKFARNNPAIIPASGVGMMFQEFLYYIVNHDPESFNEHWKPYINLCHPCTIHYDIIGKFETVERDSNRVLRYIGAPPYIKFPYFRPSKTPSILSAIEKKISTKLLDKVYEVYADDFAIFGY